VAESSLPRIPEMRRLHDRCWKKRSVTGHVRAKAAPDSALLPSYNVEQVRGVQSDKHHTL